MKLMAFQKSKPKPSKPSSARTSPPKESPAPQSAPGGQDPGGGTGWGDTGGWEADSWDDLNGKYFSKKISTYCEVLWFLKCQCGLRAENCL